MEAKREGGKGGFDESGIGLLIKAPIFINLGSKDPKCHLDW